MENRILNHIIDIRKGHYVHAIEVSNIHDLEAVANNLYEDFHTDYSIEEIIEFLDSLEVYCLNSKNEEEVFNFSFKKYIKENYE